MNKLSNIALAATAAKTVLGRNIDDTKTPAIKDLMENQLAQ